MVYSVDKTIKDLGDKVDAGEIEKANEAKEKVKAALASDDLEEINSGNGRADRNRAAAVREAV